MDRECGHTALERWRLRTRKHQTFICYYHEETNIRSMEQLTALLLFDDTSRRCVANHIQTTRCLNALHVAGAIEVDRVGHGSRRMRHRFVGHVARAGVVRREGSKRWRPHGRSSFPPARCTQRRGKRLTAYTYIYAAAQDAESS